MIRKIFTLYYGTKVLNILKGETKMNIAKEVTKLAKKVGDIAHVNSPTIFAGIAIAGVVGTVAMTTRATLKAAKVIDEARYVDPDTNDVVEPEIKDIVAMTWKYYVPCVLMAGLTIGAIVMGHNISEKRRVALAGLYSVSQDALKEYEEKVEQTIGKGKAEKIKDEIVGDKLDKNPVSQRGVIATGSGDTLCYDTWSGRYFKSDINEVKHGIDEFRVRLMSGEACSINDLYEYINLDAIGGGYEVGWSPSKPIDVRYVSKLASNGTPCFVIDYAIPPRWSFQEF